MPEGDTIFRAARTLHRALAGKTVRSFASVLPALNRVHEDAPLTGRTIERVSAAGKHLLMHLSGDLVLRTHMRMNGSWHIYRPGERWRRPRRDMRLTIATEDFEAVGFNIPVAELIASRDLPRHEELRRLGPDVLSDNFDEDEARRRLREHGDMPAAEALLNQRLIAGLGNVYKSEVLFLAGVNPFTPVRRLAESQITSLLGIARRLLLANVIDGVAPMTTYTGFRRTTGRADPQERLWVYGRTRLPCRRCGTPIGVRKQGLDARLTYWCPQCQPTTETNA
ncbi:MAG: DNA-formamidopyrimidine glycosylase family protein [Acidobacteriota bacterium]